MRTKFEDMLTEDERKTMRRWTIGVASFYALIVAGMVSVIAADIHYGGNDRNIVSFYDADGMAAAVAPASDAAANPPSGTTGISSAEINAAGANVQPIPEVDEMLVDMFNSPTTYSGTAPAQADVAISTDNRALQTVQSRK